MEQGIFAWLESFPFSDAVRSSVWVFPAVETVHVMAIVFVVGSIARVDLRLLGMIWRDRPITEVSAEMLPWTWTAFVVAAITGSMLFMGQAVKYVSIIYFDVKMVLIVLAGLNMLYFQMVTYRDIGQWDRLAVPPMAVRAAGAISLMFWLSIVAAGRFVGFI